MLPYRIGEVFEGVIPVSGASVIGSTGARNTGATHLAEWLEKCEKIWDENGQGTRTFREQLDYFAQLSAQFPIAKHRVVFAASGKLPAAARLDENALGVAEHKLYWAVTKSAKESVYLCAITNSETLRTKVAHFQSQGQWGARDFDKVMFNLSIPLFDSSQTLHQELSKAAKRAEKISGMIDIDEGDYFVTVRKRIREALYDDGIGEKIDKLVEKLLSDAG